MVNKTFIKKDNVVVMFKQTDREMSATVLTNYGCTYKEIKEHFSCKEQGNAFYKLYVNEYGFTKAVEEDFDRIVRGY